ncbi:MAG: alpha/beta fold hydrolase [Marmoricola sp.]
MRKLVAVTAASALACALGGTMTTADASPQPARHHHHHASALQRELHGARHYTPPTLDWGTCDVPRLQSAGAQCAMVTVPLDYAHPHGKKVKLAISRVEHKSDNDQGVMLVNPGGPGGSGLIYSILGPAIPNNVGADYDWIGFDPRGVGESKPNLSCDGSYFGYDRPNYVPTTHKLESFWLHKAAGYARKCDKVGGRLLDHTKSTTWAMDVDMIRKALGEKQINYYGFSYGTYLGQVYATLFPSHVRRMVWDGVVNPTKVWYQANLDQDKAFDANMTRYFAWIAKHDDVYHLGTTASAVQGLYYAKLKQLEAQPEAGGKLGPDEWTDAFLSAGYYVYGWEDLAQAFSAAINDDNWAPMLSAYDAANGAGPGSDNTYANYLAVQCTDTRWPSWPKQRLDNWRMYGQAPFETWANAWYNAPCLTWGARPSHPVRVRDRGVPPILMIAETHDAATPFSGALKARSIFGQSRLIEGVDGTTHAGSLSGVACTDDRIADYLASGKLDPRKPGDTSDVQCPPVPQPDPGANQMAPQEQRPHMPSDLRHGLVPLR